MERLGHRSWVSRLTLIAVAALSMAPSLSRADTPGPRLGQAWPTGSVLHLQFDRPLIPRRTRVVVSGAQGRTVPTRAMFYRNARYVVVTATAGFAPGSYGVKWIAVGRSGPPSRGTFSFTVP